MDTSEVSIYLVTKCRNPPQWRFLANSVSDSVTYSLQFGIYRWNLNQNKLLRRKQNNLPLDDVFPKELTSPILNAINPKKNIKEWFGRAIWMKDCLIALKILPKRLYQFKEMLVFWSSLDSYQLSALVALLNSKALGEKDTANGIEHFYLQSL